MHIIKEIYYFMEVAMKEAWRGFTNGTWENEINVRDFIQKNYKPYEGDERFL